LPVFDLVRMKVAPEVAHVAHDDRKQQRRHGEVTVERPKGQRMWYYRVKVNGHRRRRSTGHTDKALALRQAKIIALGLREDGQARTTMKRPGFATVGDVLAVWLERSPAKTRKNNASTLRKWVRSFAGQDADSVSMTRLSAEELERYLRAWPGSPEGRASTWRQIRAVFAEQPRRWYAQADLVLPDLTELRLVRAETSARELRVRGYKLIGRERLVAMDAAAELLRRSSSLEDRRIWAVYALMRWCGLRNSEVASLRWEWLKRGQRSFFWSFERRVLPDGSWYFPKGTARDVPVRWRILGQLRRALQSREGYVIPRSSMTDAVTLTERSINGFVRKFVPERTKGAYELRKQFGAEYCQKYGLPATAVVMGHGDFKTTWNHYHDLLEEAAPL
jgi:hypothetical protein